MKVVFNEVLYRLLDARVTRMPYIKIENKVHCVEFTLSFSDKVTVVICLAGF